MGIEGMVLSSGSAVMFLLLTAALFATAHAQPGAEQPSFGADASVGYGLSVISGDRLADRRHGSVLFRLDNFHTRPHLRRPSSWPWAVGTDDR